MKPNNGAFTQIKITDIAIATFAGILALVGILQGCQISRQGDLQRKAARPYLVTYPFVNNNWKDPSEHDIRVTMHIINNSVYPAQARYSRPKILIGADAATEANKCDVDYTAAPPAFVPPASPFPGANDIAVQTQYSAPIDDAERKRIVEGTDQVVVYGGVKYSSVANEDFETRYCFQSQASGYPWGTCGCTLMK